MNLKLNKKFSVEMLSGVYNSILNREIAPAGYPGEGNINWNSITIYSLNKELDQKVDESYQVISELKALGLKLRLVRFMMLEPGGVIKKHSDSFLSDRIVRLHVPVYTNDDVEFFLDDVRCKWQPGELWFGDFSKPHYGINKGRETRVHLVIDVIVNESLINLFPLNSVPVQLIAALESKNEVEMNTEILSRFNCNFHLPKGFRLPGMDFSDLEVDLKGSVKLIDTELCVLVNDQPLLKATAISEDKIALVGLPIEAHVDYFFSNKNTIESLVLNIAGTSFKVELI